MPRSRAGPAATGRPALPRSRASSKGVDKVARSQRAFAIAEAVVRIATGLLGLLFAAWVVYTLFFRH